MLRNIIWIIFLIQPTKILEEIKKQNKIEAVYIPIFIQIHTRNITLQHLDYLINNVSDI